MNDLFKNAITQLTIAVQSLSNQNEKQLFENAVKTFQTIFISNESAHIGSQSAKLEEENKSTQIIAESTPRISKKSNKPKTKKVKKIFENSCKIETAGQILDKIETQFVQPIVQSIDNYTDDILDLAQAEEIFEEQLIYQV